MSIDNSGLDCCRSYVSPYKGGSGGKRTAIDLSGHRFGKLIAVRKVERKSNQGNAIWLCRCDCGVETEVYASALIRKNTISCGCARLKMPPGEAAKRVVFYRYKTAAKKFGGLQIDKTNFYKIIESDCYYCGAAPYRVTASSGHGEYVCNGLDRVDNSLGYTLENCVSACGVCNHAKSVLPIKDFLAWICRAYCHINKTNKAPDQDYIDNAPLPRPGMLRRNGKGTRYRRVAQS